MPVLVSHLFEKRLGAVVQDKDSGAFAFHKVRRQHETLRFSVEVTSSGTRISQDHCSLQISWLRRPVFTAKRAIRLRSGASWLTNQRIIVSPWNVDCPDDLVSSDVEWAIVRVAPDGHISTQKHGFGTIGILETDFTRKSHFLVSHLTGIRRS